MMDQHELLTTILRGAGGEEVEACLPSRYQGKRADILFRDLEVIVEIKSLTSDRRRDPAVANKLGEMFAKNWEKGAPIVFGGPTVRLHDLPVPIAEKSLRIIGARVRKEVGMAREQIVATRAALEMPDAYGLVLFVSPPDRIGHHSIAWLIHDVIRKDEEARGLDGAMVIETPLCWQDDRPGAGNTFSSLWSISGKPIPREFSFRVASAWAEATGQPTCLSDVEQFTNLGSAE